MNSKKFVLSILIAIALISAGCETTRSYNREDTAESTPTGTKRSIKIDETTKGFPFSGAGLGAGFVYGGGGYYGGGVVVYGSGDFNQWTCYDISGLIMSCLQRHALRCDRAGNCFRPAYQ